MVIRTLCGESKDLEDMSVSMIYALRPRDQPLWICFSVYKVSKMWTVSEVHSRSKTLEFYFQGYVFCVCLFSLLQMVLYCSLSIVSFVHTLNIQHRLCETVFRDKS